MNDQLDPKLTGLDMKITAPANESFLNKAVTHLNKQVQREEYAPVVGGYQHDHTMR